MRYEEMEVWKYIGPLIADARKRQILVVWYVADEKHNYTIYFQHFDLAGNPDCNVSLWKYAGSLKDAKDLLHLAVKRSNHSWYLFPEVLM